ncbi:MAG: M48 family metallopeptidase [Ichthyobacteriaceae bacterium]|nr:M48 family metallopeptidase [Ichthyobacteriaceae bacterium]
MKRNLLLLIVLVFTLFSCGVNPVTGRKQLNFVSESEIFPQSFAAYNKVLNTEKVSKNKAQVKQVKRVGKKIQKAVEKFFVELGYPHMLDNYKWEYSVIESEQLNAWCMPGGKVAFYTGILPVCKNDEGVAVVMAHEIAHAIASHGAERMSQTQVQSAIGAVGSIVMGVYGTKSEYQELVLQAYGVGSQVGMLAYSREHESEADEMGIIFMSLAGYNPKVAPQFWKRMQAKSNGGQTPEFLSTHPHPKTRIDDLNKMMPYAIDAYKTGNAKKYLKYRKK